MFSMPSPLIPDNTVESSSRKQNCKMNTAATIARELGVKTAQFEATISLLDEGSTVPFIARYRKEVTGGLDDTQLRELHTRLGYLRELNDRRERVIASVEEQGKLTSELKQSFLAAVSKTELEDLYLPYKPRRRTKAQKAREAGLQPLADLLIKNRTADPEKEAAAFINKEHEINSSCLLYTSPSPRDATLSRMPSSA